MIFHYYSVSLFVEDEVEPFDPLKTVYDFIQFVDRICVVALQVGEHSELITLEVGKFVVMKAHQRRSAGNLMERK